MFFGGRRRRARAAAAERAAGFEERVRLSTESLGSASESFRRTKLFAPLMLLPALVFYGWALYSGISADWQTDEWVGRGSRAGGPLWFVLIITLGLGTLFVSATIGSIRESKRALILAEKRLDVVIAQGAADAELLEHED